MTLKPWQEKIVAEYQANPDRFAAAKGNEGLQLVSKLLNDPLILLKVK